MGGWVMSGQMGRWMNMWEFRQMNGLVDESRVMDR